ncbi:hypothetical protein R2F61_04040 [Mollicutes bacterium LVI A0078]|nr:hypothetical protein RZE84_04060 [Mollicutes bacterium LVI A0075]WOO91733.1 hypothetical protein R2F61_04040 [Mollicutes bacterium LVI A0078]
MSEIEYNNFVEHNQGQISNAITELEAVVINIDNLISNIEEEAKNNYEQKRILQKLNTQKSRINGAIDKLFSL